MSLDIKNAREMVDRIIQEVDYDIWKEMINNKENPDVWDIDYFVNIVSEYIQVDK